MNERFSERHGFERDSEITVREDAPESLRSFVFRLAVGSVLPAQSILAIVEGVVRIVPIRRTGLRDQRMAEIAQHYLSNCEWFYVYDVIEELHKELSKVSRRSLRSKPLPRTPILRDGSKRAPAREVPLLRADGFVDALNEYFRRNGIGWQLIDGKIEHRGDEAFEVTKASAISALEHAGFAVPLNELSMSMKALSERPVPDLTGAMTHARACVDSVVREVTGSSAKSFSKTIKSNPKLFPTPLGEALIKIFAYVGDEAAHPKEGRVITLNYAQFVVEMSCAAAKLLAREYRSED